MVISRKSGNEVRTNLPSRVGENSRIMQQAKEKLAIKEASKEFRSKEVTPEKRDLIAKQLGTAAANRLFLMEKPMSDNVLVAEPAKLMGEGKFGIDELNKIATQITGNTLKMAPAGAKEIALFAADKNVWASELLFAQQTAQALGYKVQLFTPSGKPPEFLEPSTTVGFRDLPRSGLEVTEGEGALAARAKQEGTPEYEFLNSAKPISSLIPQEPYPVEAIEKGPEATAAAYAAQVEKGVKEFGDKFGAMWIAGGSGGFELHQTNLETLVSAAAALKMPIGVNCYGTNPLAHAKTADGRFLVDGHTLAAHTKTHDWKYEPWQAQPPFELEGALKTRGADVLARPMNNLISAVSTNKYGETIVSSASTHDGLVGSILLFDKMQNGGIAKKGEAKVVVDFDAARNVNNGDLELSRR